MAGFIEALRAEIAALERALAEDPRYEKLDRLRDLLGFYEGFPGGVSRVGVGVADKEFPGRAGDVLKAMMRLAARGEAASGPGAIARVGRMPAGSVSAALNALAAAGLVGSLGDGRWRLMGEEGVGARGAEVSVRGRVPEEAAEAAEAEAAEAMAHSAWEAPPLQESAASAAAAGGVETSDLLEEQGPAGNGGETGGGDGALGGALAGAPTRPAVGIAADYETVRLFLEDIGHTVRHGGGGGFIVDGVSVTWGELIAEANALRRLSGLAEYRVEARADG